MTQYLNTYAAMIVLGLAAGLITACFVLGTIAAAVAEHSKPTATNALVLMNHIATLEDL